MNKEDVVKKIIHATIYSTAKTAFNSGRNDAEHDFEELDLMIKTMEESLFLALKNIAKENS